MQYTCQKCGKLHPQGYKCTAPRQYKKTDERKLRSSYDWTKKSLEVRDKAHFLCEVCRDNGVITYEGVEVHHIEKLSDNKDGLLDNSNLVCLCQKHHKEADAGMIDKDYLKRLAEHREA